MLSQALKSEKLGYSLRELVNQRQNLEEANTKGLGLTFDSLFNELVYGVLGTF